jgi:hypothetical protein
MKLITHSYPYYVVLLLTNIVFVPCSRSIRTFHTLIESWLLFQDLAMLCVLQMVVANVRLKNAVKALLGYQNKIFFTSFLCSYSSIFVHFMTSHSILDFCHTSSKSRSTSIMLIVLFKIWMYQWRYSIKMLFIEVYKYYVSEKSLYLYHFIELHTIVIILKILWIYSRLRVPNSCFQPDG